MLYVYLITKQFSEQEAAADKKLFDTLLEDVTAGGMSKRRRHRGADERGVGWDDDSDTDDEIRRFKARYRQKGLMRNIDDDGSEWAKLGEHPHNAAMFICSSKIMKKTVIM